MIKKYSECIFIPGTADATSIWSNKSNSLIHWDSQCQVWICDLEDQGHFYCVCHTSWILNNAWILSLVLSCKFELQWNVKKWQWCGDSEGCLQVVL